MHKTDSNALVCGLQDCDYQTASMLNDKESSDEQSDEPNDDDG